MSSCDCKKSGGCKKSENKDGKIQLKNPHIDGMQEDFLYHLALGTEMHDFKEMFGDVKFVCMGGTNHRMEEFAHFMANEIKLKLPTGTKLMDLSATSHRFCLYKVGPIISVSHGMGEPSLSILLHEMIKLLYHADAKDPVFIRIGTCGGVGVDQGSVIVSSGAVDGMCNNYSQVPILGKIVRRPAILNQCLVKKFLSLARETDNFKIISGITMSAFDFYEGQGRVDGAFCDYTEEDKFDYLRKLNDFGVVNIEMESTTFAALTHHAGIKAAIICVALVNRFNGDQVTTPKDILLEYQTRPQRLVSRYIKKCLSES